MRVCVCACTLCVACTTARVRRNICCACVQLDVLHSSMCVCAFNYVMITYANHDVLTNNILPVSILVTEYFDNTVESNHTMSLFCYFALQALVIRKSVHIIIHS